MTDALPPDDANDDLRVVRALSWVLIGLGSLVVAAAIALSLWAGAGGH